MTTDPDAPREHDEADRGRPSSTRGRGEQSVVVASADDRSPDIGVRPYYMTRGRTRTDRPLAVEALVEITERGLDVVDQLQFEQQEIALVCRRPTSLAEIAAHVRVPLGVVRVLVADLAGTGLLQVHDAPARIQDDIPLIQRLIHGVRAL